uniref:Mitoguardin 2 n=1 Tax=Cyprinus carpio carpio TaxID=630221 RepID=A0A9J8CGQ7_CYPCA
MSIRSAEGVSIMQALAMTVAEIPVFLYSTFGQSIFSQLKLSPSLKKVLFATALGSVALALTAHQLKRRGRKRKQVVSKEAQKPVGVPEQLRTGRPASLKRGPVPGRQMMSPSTRSNDTLSGVSSLTQSKHSSSSHSIASVREPQSYTHRLPIYVSTNPYYRVSLTFCLDPPQMRVPSSPNQSVNTGMLREPDLHNHQFAKKLESLLHRAYHLQEDFGGTIPADGLLADLESEATLILPTPGSSHPTRDDDARTVTSDESFFSAAEVRTISVVAHGARTDGKTHSVLFLCLCYRTELLECYSDEDFLAKLHCVRQAFQVLLLDETHRMFFMDTGKQIISGLLAKANKSPKAFLESYDDMLQYTQREETWPVTKMELEGRGVVCMNFFDMVLDFILMDAFEDLESPPSSVVAILRNRWLSDSFKETALATACWSVLKAKRRLLMVPDGFIAHFYAISEHVSPVLAFGFLGPRQHLSEVCTTFKQQIVQYLKDMFDHDKMRFTSVQSLAEDILSLSHRRADILVGYLGIDSLPEANGALPKSQAKSGQQD